jgi:hypothetical protein
MSSRETDLADRRQRERQLDANLAQARAGKDRLRDRTDAEVPDAYGDRPTPNVGGRS